MKKSLLLLLLLNVTSYAWGDCAGVACTEVYVEEIYVRAAGKNLLKTSGDETKLDCNPDSGVYLEIPEYSNKNDLMSVLLAAQMANKKVRVRIVPNTACEISYITIRQQ